jgi:hypothetical protein
MERGTLQHLCAQALDLSNHTATEKVTLKKVDKLLRSLKMWRILAIPKVRNAPVF